MNSFFNGRYPILETMCLLINSWPTFYCIDFCILKLRENPGRKTETINSSKMQKSNRVSSSTAPSMTTPFHSTTSTGFFSLEDVRQGWARTRWDNNSQWTSHLSIKRKWSIEMFNYLNSDCLFCLHFDHPEQGNYIKELTSELRGLFDFFTTHFHIKYYLK